MNDYFGFEACYESVAFDIEFLHADPIAKLGEFTLRAKQDIFFNDTMIDALLKYIEDHGIRWDDKKKTL